MPRVAELVEAQRLRLDRFQGRATRSQLKIIRAALDDTMAALRAGGLGAWGVASEEWTRVMLVAGFRQLASRQVGQLGLDILEATRLSVADQAQWFRTMDRHFHGAARPLRWDSLDWLERQGRAQRRTRLRLYRRSFERYGAMAVQDIEDAITKRILVGDPWDKAMVEVERAMDHVSEGREWMVRRTVDTETAAAYNGAAYEALRAEDTDPRDPMFKRLVAVWDHVIAKDSMILHGQTRRVGEPFYDSYHGFEYDHPPNRPHDREQIVGWRKSWGSDVPHFRPDPRRPKPKPARARGPTVKPARRRQPGRSGVLSTGIGLVITEQLLANRRAREDALRQIAQAQTPEQTTSAEALLVQLNATARRLEREAAQVARMPSAAIGAAVAAGVAASGEPEP